MLPCLRSNIISDKLLRLLPGLCDSSMCGGSRARKKPQSYLWSSSVMALLITARMCIAASEGASGFAALRRAAPPHSPSALLASGLVTYARYVMQNAMTERSSEGFGLRMFLGARAMDEVG